MNWLCVEVRYLFDKYHGSRDGGRRADYPPSAHRLFQALIAAANNGQSMSAAAKEALQWLEKQLPPQIYRAGGIVARVSPYYVRSQQRHERGGKSMGEGQGTREETGGVADSENPPTSTSWR
jgi:CRISPR-associated protein Csb2